MRPKAIICDIDGTLANCAHRVMYVDGSVRKDWNKFNALSVNDTVNEWCLNLVRAYNEAGYKIIFLTARSGSPETKKITEQWLQNNVGFIPHILLMRKENDYRTDFITKQEIYNLEVAPYYDVEVAIDDKLAVCQMFRSCGIAAFHCAD